MADRASIRVRVNGTQYTAEVPHRMLLSDFLRDELHLTGTHVGCEHGVCGACTVLVDGSSVRSCLYLAVQSEGAEITTVEGLGAPEQLTPLQQCFSQQHALQCGYCTPGFLMTAVELLAENPDPTEQEVRSAISGNICRCTGYQNIVDAILAAASGRRNEA